MGRFRPDPAEFVVLGRVLDVPPIICRVASIYVGSSSHQEITIYFISTARSKPAVGVDISPDFRWDN